MIHLSATFFSTKARAHSVCHTGNFSIQDGADWRKRWEDDDENESQTLWYLLRSIVLLIDICKISSSLLSPALYFWNSGVASHLQLIIIYRGKIIVFISNKLIVYFLRIDLKLYILSYDTIPINLQSSFYLNDYPSSSFLNNTHCYFLSLLYWRLGKWL